jgi:hypothetical protein
MTARVRRLAALAPPTALTLGLLLVATSSAFAQPREPIPWFAVDVQGALPKLPTDPALAAARGVDAAMLPAWGPGVNLGAHAFPLRTKWVTFGAGASYQWVRGSKSPPETAPGPSVTTKFSAIVPQLSLNFGHELGWSYLSVGLGGSTLTVSRDDLPEEEGEAIKTLNWGGGGRWFMKDHLAFSFDVRIYAVNSQAASDLTAGHPRMNIVVLNVGVSIQ